MAPMDEQTAPRHIFVAEMLGLASLHSSSDAYCAIHNKRDDQSKQRVAGELWAALEDTSKDGFTKMYQGLADALVAEKAPANMSTDNLLQRIKTYRESGAVTKKFPKISWPWENDVGVRPTASEVAAGKAAALKTAAASKAAAIKAARAPKDAAAPKAAAAAAPKRAVASKAAAAAAPKKAVASKEAAAAAAAAPKQAVPPQAAVAAVPVAGEGVPAGGLNVQGGKGKRGRGPQASEPPADKVPRS